MMRNQMRFLMATVAAVLLPAMANAADMPVKARVAPASVIEYGNVYFGVDATTHRGLAGYWGVLYAPFGMHQSGLRLSVFGLVGHYEYHGGAGERFKGDFGSVDGLVGWSHVFGNGAVTLAVGANYQDHRVRPADPNNSVQGAKTGFKVQGDLWLHPTQRTLVYALGSYSTAFDTYYSVGRFGVDIFNTKVFFGPEIGALGNDRTDQQRLGLHLTGIPFAGGKVTVSGGWLRERGEGDGAYGAASIDFSF